jgi:hypothetical protein
MTPFALRDLLRAYDAFARKDCISAAQHALRAAQRKTNPPEVRCDAYVLLTLTALQLDSPEPALAYAVGANLLAYKLQDEVAEKEAEAVLDLVLAQYPELSGGRLDPEH